MIVVFWLHNNEANHVMYNADELTRALKFCETLRKHSETSHITISSEMTGSVGKSGVDEVADGKTPDGVEYSWVKRRPPTVADTSSEP